MDEFVIPAGLVKGDTFTIEGSYSINPEPQPLPQIGDILPILIDDKEWARAVVTESNHQGCKLVIIEAKPVSSETP